MSSGADVYDISIDNRINLSAVADKMHYYAPKPMSLVERLPRGDGSRTLTACQTLQQPISSKVELFSSLTSCHSRIGHPSVLRRRGRSNTSPTLIGGTCPPTCTGTNFERMGMRSVRRLRYIRFAFEKCHDGSTSVEVILRGMVVRLTYVMTSFAISIVSVFHPVGLHDLLQPAPIHDVIYLVSSRKLSARRFISLMQLEQSDTTHHESSG
jgi:hypothetical protein